MPDPATEGAETPARLRHRCLRELVHALNGRASVVRGLAEIAGMEGGGRHPDAQHANGAPTPRSELAGLLVHEADALEDVARLLQLVVPPAREEPELLDPVDLLDEALEMHGFLEGASLFGSGHRRRREERADGGEGDEGGEGRAVPPLRTRPSALRGRLLVALDQAQRILDGQEALGGEDPAVVWLRCESPEGLALEVCRRNGTSPLRIPLSPGPGARDEPAI